MFLFRSLNEFDVLTNPTENGITSKSMSKALNYYQNQETHAIAVIYTN